MAFEWSAEEVCYSLAHSVFGLMKKLAWNGDLLKLDKADGGLLQVRITIALLLRDLKRETVKRRLAKKMYKVYEIKKRVFEDNDREADKLREELREKRTFLMNLMSSPGGGKTTTLKRTINALKDEMRIGVMEADIDSAVDADAVSETGVKVIQLHTGGMCHLDADMTRQGLEEMGTEDVDLAILENVGNLVCPAEFDTGSVKNVMILSVPEGDDKPLKYPLMFQVSHCLLINKIDTVSCFDFDFKACEERVRRLNPDIKIIPVSAKTGEGMDEWYDWLRKQVQEWNGSCFKE